MANAPNCENKYQYSGSQFAHAKLPTLGQRISLAQASLWSGVFDNFVGGGNVRRAYLCLPIVTAAVFAFICYQAAAQEAGTTPTCTGCSNSNASAGRGSPTNTRSRNTKRVSSKNSQLRAETGSLLGYNGTWSGVSTGHCIATWNWKIEVNNGNISGNNISGHVSRGGSANGSMIVFGTRYNFVGHMSLNQATGTWTTGGNCSGGWTAAKS